MICRKVKTVSLKSLNYSRDVTYHKLPAAGPRIVVFVLLIPAWCNIYIYIYVYT